MKKTMVAGLVLAGVLSATQALAVPVFAPGVDNDLTFSAEANRVSGSGAALANTAAYNVGDVFYGVVNLEAVSNGVTGTTWNMQNTGSGPYDTFSGYFVTEIKAVNTVGTSRFLTLGAASFDPKGIFDGADIAAQTLVKFYTDSSTRYTVGGPVGADINNATDGAFWGSLGFAGNGFWDVQMYGNGAGGTVGAGINFISNNSGLNFDKVVGSDCDPSFNCTAPLVDMIFNSTFSRTAGAWGYHISDPLTVHPVPLPAAAWMLGSGLIGLAGVARTRRKKQ